MTLAIGSPWAFGRGKEFVEPFPNLIWGQGWSRQLGSYVVVTESSPANAHRAVWGEAEFRAFVGLAEGARRRVAFRIQSENDRKTFLEVFGNSADLDVEVFARAEGGIPPSDSAKRWAEGVLGAGKGTPGFGKRRLRVGSVATVGSEVVYSEAVIVDGARAPTLVRELELRGRRGAEALVVLLGFVSLPIERVSATRLREVVEAQGTALGSIFRIVVDLPQNRRRLGTLELIGPGGTSYGGPFWVCGRADWSAPANEGKPKPDRVRPFGDTPTGGYWVSGVEATGAGTRLSNVRSYGVSGALRLIPRSGEAAVAAAQGRTGLLVHGGHTGPTAAFLRPTNGCIRMTDRDLAQLIDRLERAGVRFPIVLEVREANPTGSETWLSGADEGYSEGDPPP